MTSHVVLVAAALAALASAAFVPPDGAYLSYADWHTIACLFSMLAIIGALRRMGVFETVARLAVQQFSGNRLLTAGALVGVTALLSMVATNDVALLMMLPLAAAVLLRSQWARLVPAVFVLQGLAANLCGMIIPFGNPQNLYLYSYYDLRLGEFLSAMALPFAVSCLFIAMATGLLCRREKAGAANSDLDDAAHAEGSPRTLSIAPVAFSSVRLGIYSALFLLVIAGVFRLVPTALMTAVVLAFLLAMDRTALRQVDYPLLLTFLCFFVFAGNMARIPAVVQGIEGLMAQSGLMASALLSQVISNVPAAVLLSHFTDGWQVLLVGVNIGGAGTPVGSLASLIVLQQFLTLRRSLGVKRRQELSVSRFWKLFLGLNLIALALLLIVCSL
nr:SLC13 family permease [Adlercreutzia aquisgranensis]